MMVLSRVSMLVKIAAVGFLIGFVCGLWFAGQVGPAVLPEPAVPAAEAA